MKSLLFCLCFILSLNSFSQTKELKITKAKIAELKNLSDLITDIPKDCKVYSFTFSAGVHGSLKEFKCTGDGISPELKSIMSYKEKGEWFFIENIKSSCEKSHKSTYKITFE